MKRRNTVELGLTIPLQRYLGVKLPPCEMGADRRFCWDLHVISLRGRPGLLSVHCCTRYAFVLYDPGPLGCEGLMDIFLHGLDRSLSAAGFPPETARRLWGTPSLTRTHGRREVAFLNRAWEDVMAMELALDEGGWSQPLLDRLVNARPSRCAGAGGRGTAAERMAKMLFKI